MLTAACSSPARGEEGGPATRATWTPSDAHDNLIVHLAFSPDGRILASAGYDSIRLSDPGTERELATLKTAKTSPPRDLAFSPDGKTLASASCQVVQFWDLSAALKYAGSKWRRVE